MRPYFVYTSSLTRSTLVWKIFGFSKFATELRPLIDVRIWFLLHILRMNVQNLAVFCIHIIDKIYVEIVKRHFFFKIATELQPLIAIRIWFSFNILRINIKSLTKFCILIITDKIYV